MKNWKKGMVGAIVATALILGSATSAYAKPPPRDHSGGPWIIIICSVLVIGGLIGLLTKNNNDRPASP